MQWLKAATARRANGMLHLSGTFWQAESYDRWVRSKREWTKIVRYVEWNPVKAGLVKGIEDWPWSSASYGGRQQDCPPYRSSIEIRR
jgi:REP element-mobilizing transposase RayT